VSQYLSSRPCFSAPLQNFKASSNFHAPYLGFQRSMVSYTSSI
jgi:hypothetical protein